MIAVKTGKKELKIYKSINKENFLTFEVDTSKVSFHHRDLVNVYYFVLKNIRLINDKDIKTDTSLKIKNAVFVSKIVKIVDGKKEIIRPEEIDEIEEKAYYYRLPLLFISGNRVALNLVALLNIKETIEEFFKQSQSFEMRFKENNFDLIIAKKDNIVSLQFIKNDSKEILRISKDEFKTLLRAINDKMLLTWQLTKINIANKVFIYPFRENSFIIEFNNKKFSIGRDTLIAISLACQ